MSRLLCIISFLILSSFSNAQNKRDFYWPEGLRTTEVSTEPRGIAFDFNSLPMVPERRDSELGFSRTIGTICDRDGQFLFYTNGCQVADRTHSFMMNGDSLNYNNYIEQWLDGCERGAIDRQDILILPDPGDEEGYYIIHKPSEYLLEGGQNIFWNEYIRYSYVDMRENGGLGAVTEKNAPILNEFIQWSHMTAINHQNGKHWWILQPGFDSTYYRMLIDDRGFSVLDSQAIGPRFLRDYVEKVAANGKSRFSPDGTKYVHFDLFEGLHLYDFDRSTGLLRNGRYLDWTRVNENNFACSVEFSPDSRFIYLINQFSLFQVDTWEADLASGLTHIADRDSTIVAPFRTTFFDMLLAPDCKIYVRTGSSSTLMHVIHEPNEQGQDCDFRQGDLVLPRISSLGGFPTFPPFRVDGEDNCNPSLSIVDGVNAFWRRDLLLSPNPARQETVLELPEHTTVQLRVIDIQGAIHLNKKLSTSDKRHVIDLESFSSGVYIVQVIPEKNPDKIMYQGRLVVVK